jgi:hypothetical protein
MEGPDEKTPVRTAEAQAIFDLLDELVRLERDLRPLARSLDQLPKAERRAFLERLMSRLRQVGELGHMSARVIWNILRSRKD